MGTGPLKGFLTTEQAADQLGVTERTIRNWIESGRLRAARLDPDNPRSPYRIPREEVDRIITDRDRQLSSDA